MHESSTFHLFHSMPNLLLHNMKKINIFFCQINAFTKELISRKIEHFVENEKFTRTHCGNYGNSLSRIFGKNVVKVTVLLSKLLKSWFDEIFLWWDFLVFPRCVIVKVWKLWKSTHSPSKFLYFPHCDCGKMRNLLSSLFIKNFVKARHLLNELLKGWFDGKKLWWE